MLDLLNKTASDNMTKAELLEYIKAQQAEKEGLSAKLKAQQAEMEALAEKAAEAEKEDDIPEAKDTSSEGIKAWLNERVPFIAFKDNDKYKDDIVVGINGKAFIIQRGKQVMIPRYVKLVLDSSMAQEAHAADVMQGFQDQHTRRAAELEL